MNRRERRKLEKQLGLLKKYQKSSKEEKSEIRQRRFEMGKKIHQQNLENLFNAQNAVEEARQMKFIEDCVAQGMTPEEAKRILEHNLQLLEAREEELKNRDLRRLKNKTQIS